MTLEYDQYRQDKYLNYSLGHNVGLVGDACKTHSIPHKDLLSEVKPVATGSDRALRRRPPCWEAGQVVMKQKNIGQKISELPLQHLRKSLWKSQQAIELLFVSCRMHAGLKPIDDLIP